MRDGTTNGQEHAKKPEAGKHGGEERKSAIPSWGLDHQNRELGGKDRHQKKVHDVRKPQIVGFWKSRWK